MPKVIKEPEPQDELQVKCRDCRATIGYIPNEVQEGVHHSYDGSSDAVYWIKCPRCGKELYLSSRYKP